MGLWLHTEGDTVVAVAVCDRCKMKRHSTFLVPDPNTPGLRVCKDTCVDVYDPWRLAPRTTEDITVKGVRPEVAILNSRVFSMTYTPKAGSYTQGENILGVLSRTQAVLQTAAGGVITYLEDGGLSFQIGEIVLGLTSGATGICNSQVGQN